MALEKALKNLSENVLLDIIFGVPSIVNEVVQQGKHAYYHLAGISHKRVRKEDIDSQAFFDYLSVYTKEN
jgi:hypothetical protein